MGNNRVRGFSFEREIVNLLKGEDLSAKRAPGSDGRNIGEEKEVDIVASIYPNSESMPIKLQAKRFKRLTTRIKPEDHIDAQVIRADNEPAFVVLRLDKYIDLLKKTRLDHDTSIVKKRIKAYHLIRQRKRNR